MFALFLCSFVPSFAIERSNGESWPAERVDMVTVRDGPTAFSEITIELMAPPELTEPSTRVPLWIDLPPRAHVVRVSSRDTANSWIDARLVSGRPLELVRPGPAVRELDPPMLTLDRGAKLIGSVDLFAADESRPARGTLRLGIVEPDATSSASLACASGSWLVARLGGRQTPPDPIESLAVVVDTSASSAPTLTPDLEAVGRLLDDLPPDTAVSIFATDPPALRFEGPAGKSHSSLASLRPRGAAGLASSWRAISGALATVPRARLLLVGDFEPCRGCGPVRGTFRRVDSFLSAGDENAALERVGGRGLVIRDPVELSRALRSAPVPGGSVFVVGSRGSFPAELDPAGTGQARFVAADLRGPAPNTVTISVGSAAETVEVVPGGVTCVSLAKAMAGIGALRSSSAFMLGDGVGTVLEPRPSISGESVVESPAPVTARVGWARVVRRLEDILSATAGESIVPYWPWFEPRPAEDRITTSKTLHSDEPTEEVEEPATSLSSVEVSGAIDPAEVVSRLTNLTLRLSPCTRHTRSSTTPARVETSFEITPKGRPRRVEVSRDRTDELEPCVASRIAEWRFPTAADSTRVMASFEFEGDQVRLVHPKLAESLAPQLSEIMGLVARGALENATTLADRWVRSSPNHRLAWFSLAEAMRASGRLDEAGVAYESLQDLATQGPERRFAAVGLASVGQSGALEGLTSDDAKTPEPHDARLLAYELAARGRFKEAVASLERVLLARHPTGRWHGLVRVLRSDLSLICAAWVHTEPSQEVQLEQILLRLGAPPLPRAPLLRLALHFEDERADLDLAVFDSVGARTSKDRADIPGAFHLGDAAELGPEVIDLDPSRQDELSVSVLMKGSKAAVPGYLHVAELDDEGVLTVSLRPLVVDRPDAWIQLATLMGPVPSGP
ncbi:MAG: hypothetical protein HY791_00585 [Deltaproteobacteria bacterium]|nr:hypothetical protein [Deltaproteobacteria bacterium]